jgi:hypothetical protein
MLKNLVLLSLLFVCSSCYSQKKISKDLRLDIKVALKRADGFLKKNLESHFLALILNNLGKNNLHKNSFLIKELLEAPPSYKEEKALIKYMQRISYAKNDVNLSYIDSIPDPTDRLLVNALFCDQKPLHADCLKTLISFCDIKQNPRAGAHAALVINWIKQLNQIKQIPDIEQLKENITRQLVPAIGTSDTGMEAALGLLYLGQKNNFTADYIQQILDKQQQDGGWTWGENEGSTYSHEHPTVLAVCLLSTSLNIKAFHKMKLVL